MLLHLLVLAYRLNLAMIFVCGLVDIALGLSWHILSELVDGSFGFGSSDNGNKPRPIAPS